MVNYANAPIKEALIELRFSKKLKSEELEAFRKSILEDEFGDIEPITTMEMGFNIDGNEVSTTKTSRLAGYTLSLSQTFKIRLLHDRVIWSQSAPYDSWDKLLEKAEGVWPCIAKIFNLSDLSRIGVRYVNDLAIPFNDHGSVDLEDYVLVLPRAPEGVPSQATGFLSRLIFEHPEQSAKSNLSIASDKVLDNEVHIILDIDVYRLYQAGYSGTFIELKSVLETLRSLKNNLFEHCITVKTRELFR